MTIRKLALETGVRNRARVGSEDVRDLSRTGAAASSKTSLDTATVNSYIDFYRCDAMVLLDPNVAETQ